VWFCQSSSRCSCRRLCFEKKRYCIRVLPTPPYSWWLIWLPLPWQFSLTISVIHASIRCFGSLNHFQNEMGMVHAAFENERRLCQTKIRWGEVSCFIAWVFSYSILSIAPKKTSLEHLTAYELELLTLVLNVQLSRRFTYGFGTRPKAVQDNDSVEWSSSFRCLSCWAHFLYSVLSIALNNI